MGRKDERNLNITIKNQENEKEEMIISVSAILKHLKKYFAIWLAVAIIGGVVATAYSGFKTMVAKPNINALVSFTYNGIEQGLDPAFIGRYQPIEIMMHRSWDKFLAEGL